MFDQGKPHQRRGRKGLQKFPVPIVQGNYADSGLYELRIPLEKIDEFGRYEALGQKGNADPPLQEHLHGAIGDFVDFIDRLKRIGSRAERDPRGGPSLSGELPFQGLRQIFVESDLSRRGRSGEPPRVTIDAAMDAASGEVDGGRVLEAAERGGLEEGTLTLFLDDSYMW